MDSGISVPHRTRASNVSPSSNSSCKPCRNSCKDKSLVGCSKCPASSHLEAARTRNYGISHWTDCSINPIIIQARYYVLVRKYTCVDKNQWSHPFLRISNKSITHVWQMCFMYNYYTIGYAKKYLFHGESYSLENGKEVKFPVCSLSHFTVRSGCLLFIWATTFPFRFDLWSQ